MEGDELSASRPGCLAVGKGSLCRQLGEGEQQSRWEKYSWPINDTVSTAEDKETLKRRIFHNGELHKIYHFPAVLTWLSHRCEKETNKEGNK
jgi:hypothetical protein